MFSFVLSTKLNDDLKVFEVQSADGDWWSGQTEDQEVLVFDLEPGTLGNLLYDMSQADVPWNSTFSMTVSPDTDMEGEDDLYKTVQEVSLLLDECWSEEDRDGLVFSFNPDLEIITSETYLAEEPDAEVFNWERANKDFHEIPSPTTQVSRCCGGGCSDWGTINIDGLKVDSLDVDRNQTPTRILPTFTGGDYSVYVHIGPKVNRIGTLESITWSNRRDLNKIIGTITFSVYDRHPVYELLNSSQRIPGVASLLDLDPIHLTLVGTNTNGDAASCALLGVEFQNETMGFSTLDLGNSMVVEFTAEEYVPWLPVIVNGPVRLPTPEEFQLEPVDISLEVPMVEPREPVREDWMSLNMRRVALSACSRREPKRLVEDEFVYERAD